MLAQIKEGISYETVAFSMKIIIFKAKAADLILNDSV